MTSKLLLTANGVGLALLALVPSTADRFEVVFGVLASACVTLAGATLFFIRKWMAAREAFESQDLQSHHKIEERLSRLERELAVMRETLEHVASGMGRIEAKVS